MKTAPKPTAATALFQIALACIALAGSGCSSLAFPIQGRPVQSIPPYQLAEPKRNLVPIDISLLSQPAPSIYRLDEGDVLGVVIEGIVPYRGPEDPPVLPPVQFPQEDFALPPAIGVPLAVQPGGEIALWEVGRLNVRGMTLEEAAEAIRQRYIAEEFLREDAKRPTVTLIRPRQTQVLVIREDTGQSTRQNVLGNSNAATGGPVTLAAYKNDVLNALMASGGLPGLEAKNEIQIFRRRKEGVVENRVPLSLIDAGQFPEGAELILDENEHLDGPSLVIPLRVPVGSRPSLTPEDVILNEGDIVYIANRTTEVFYSAGLLPAGQHLLPRDYDIDIFEAMSIAGYSYGSSGNSRGGGGLIPGGSQVPATQLYIFRENGSGCDTVIEIDLADAVQCCNHKVLIKPGDTLFLRHNCAEEATNFGIATFFTFGIRELFR